jgi:hypothetical protein
MGSVKHLKDWDRIYRPGVDFDEAPVDKWDHGRSLALTLASEMISYHERTSPDSRTEFSEDHRTATVRAHLDPEPPMKRWRLMLNDCLHAYRSSLDGLAWALAHLDDRSPAPKVASQLYFPLAKSEKDWLKLRSRQLASMPEIVLSRLELLQPYRFPDVENSIGVLLHKMDVLDKHRNELVPTLRAVDKYSYSMTYSFGTQNGDITEGFEFVAPQGQIHHGDPVFELRNSTPFEVLEVQALPLVLCVEIDGGVRNVFSLLDLIERQVAGTFAALCVGYTDEAWSAHIEQGAARPSTPWYPNRSRYDEEWAARAT